MDDYSFTIQRYTGDFEDLIDFFLMSTGLSSVDGARHLIAIERTRGTTYYTAAQNGKTVGMIGVYFDTTGTVNELEPPQIIDLAVLQEHRRTGVARALMAVAENAVCAAGHQRLWLYTDGNSANLTTFYRRLGFRLVSVIPDWFGDRTCKAYFRKDL